MAKRTIRRLLIANRGEIAVRIIRACRELGIETVAVYSTADKENLHVKMADRAVCIGAAPSAKSYLNKEALVTAALLTGAEAVHPGVGFLSESADFARSVEKAGLVWIGPRPETIETVGDKVAARATAIKAGLPVTPGSDGAVPSDNVDEAKKIAGKCGYPVIIKAASGGGGKGMRIVRAEKDLAENLKLCSSEAQANFGDGTVYIEKYIETPRHVELQVLGDGRGGVAILGERDCSMQKNHQKLIEESPSPAVTDSMRKKMCQGAQKLFEDLKYCGAGTIEFLVEDGHFYFMEVNARIQVEHPVSELVTHTDLIRDQINVCVGNAMETAKGVHETDGWAIEARINARAPGKVTRLEIPGGPGVRFDSFLYNGYTVLPHYDAMLAKVIVHDTTRERARKRLLRALGELVIEGVPTNLEEQKFLLESAEFAKGNFGTDLYERLVPAGSRASCHNIENVRRG